eukprot:scaffold7378_cov17-Tisochrysis_lutea.AAC.1
MHLAPQIMTRPVLVRPTASGAGLAALTERKLEVFQNRHTQMGCPHPPNGCLVSIDHNNLVPPAVS